MPELNDITSVTPESDSTAECVLGDVVAGFIDAYLKVNDEIKRLSEVRDAVGRQIQNALGEAEIGTHRGRTVVRWTRYSTRRLSKDLVAQHLTPDEMADCYTVTEARKFTVMERT